MENTSRRRKMIKSCIPAPIRKLRRQLLYGNLIQEWKGERVRKRSRFLQTKSLSMSQAGQDLWVYGEVFNEKREGYFLDVGAHDGARFSNTFILETRYGWKGLCIEANPNTFQELRKNRTACCLNVCVDSSEQEVIFKKASVGGGIVAADCDNKEVSGDQNVKLKTMTLERILREQSSPSVIDYLSIDIEGAEDRALLNFSFDKYRFNCITIERPSAKLRNLLDSNGYRLLKEIPGLDCFYLHESFIPVYFENMISFFEKKFRIANWE
jgi:FkbM family methyltransferase